MFTGIVQGLGRVRAVQDEPGLRRLQVDLPQGLGQELQVGASVAVNGVCLTITAFHELGQQQGWCLSFDAMLQTLQATRLGQLAEGQAVHIERAARAHDEIGGHVLSGHIDCLATVLEVRTPPGNRVLRLALPEPWMRYVFTRGFVALHGASLTVADVNQAWGWFEVWLIPETLRQTIFAHCLPGDQLHVEIDRNTQVLVETVERMVQQYMQEKFPERSQP
jgi:riboflavin synthase